MIKYTRVFKVGMNGIAEFYGLPVICCGNKGFCIAETDDEMKKFNENRDKRITMIRKTQKIANRNYEE